MAALEVSAMDVGERQSLYVGPRQAQAVHDALHP
jgi:hypothetical protein